MHQAMTRQTIQTTTMAAGAAKMAYDNALKSLSDAAWSNKPSGIR
jgi:hypothetical protein